MNVDFIIVGQGISGTLLQWFLHQEGQSFMVIDNGSDRASSKVAAGIINPVTGRRYQTTWKADELLPFAVRTYGELGNFFGTTYLHPKSVIDFFPSAQARNIFVERVEAGNAYLSPYPDQNDYNPYVHYDFGCGRIHPAYVTSLGALLADWRGWLRREGRLREEHFAPELVQPEAEGVVYGDITAQKVIFCEGAPGDQNPWFRLLPFAPNKGEALFIECKDLPATHILKKGFLLAPLAEPGMFWAGSSYAWEDLESGPTEAFRLRTEALLDGMLRVPYKVLDHKAAVRPATVERRPFIGLHPGHPQIGIFNGMGTKGTSLSPYFAQQLVNHLLHGAPLTPEADVSRFSRLLSR